MKELISKFQTLKAEATELLMEGKVNAYIQKLVEVDQVKTEMLIAGSAA
jgi:hypothetical protein